MTGKIDLNRLNIRELLRYAVEKLSSAGVESPLLDVEVLLSHATGLSRIQIIAHPEMKLSEEKVRLFDAWLQRRCFREPLAYIIGEKEFYGLCFEVNPSVLVPRADTEILVEESINIVKHIDKPVIADVGVGSGAIAISIAENVPDSIVYGTDLSPGALEIARRNAARFGAGDRIRLIQGDLLQPLQKEMLDLIISNPPYIPSGIIDCLQPEVAKYEPRGALDGGIDGLDYYRRLTKESPLYLKSGGALAVEVGVLQSDVVSELFQLNDFKDIYSMKDYNGINRVVAGYKR